MLIGEVEIKVRVSATAKVISWEEMGGYHEQPLWHIHTASSSLLLSLTKLPVSPSLSCHLTFSPVLHGLRGWRRLTTARHRPGPRPRSCTVRTSTHTPCANQPTHASWGPTNSTARTHANKHTLSWRPMEASTNPRILWLSANTLLTWSKYRHTHTNRAVLWNNIYHQIYF